MAIKSPEQQKQDPRVVRTRQLITDAMAGLLQEKNLAVITVQDIADRATINRATFYSHFEDKFALFTWMVKDMFAHTLNEHVPEDAIYSFENLKTLIVAVCEILESMNSHCSPTDQEFRPMFEMEMQSQIHEKLQSWMPEDDHANRELRARVMSWGIFGSVNEWAREPKRQPAPAFAAKLAGLLEQEHLVAAH